MSRQVNGDFWAVWTITFYLRSCTAIFRKFTSYSTSRDRLFIKPWSIILTVKLLSAKRKSCLFNWQTRYLWTDKFTLICGIGCRQTKSALILTSGAILAFRHDSWKWNTKRSCLQLQQRRNYNFVWLSCLWMKITTY